MPVVDQLCSATYLTGVHLTGMYFMSVHLTDVYIMGVHLMARTS
jgi:hypothetical protein